MAGGRLFYSYVLLLGFTPPSPQDIKATPEISLSLSLYIYTLSVHLFPSFSTLLKVGVGGGKKVD